MHCGPILLCFFLPLFDVLHDAFLIVVVATVSVADGVGHLLTCVWTLGLDRLLGHLNVFVSPGLGGRETIL